MENSNININAEILDILHDFTSYKHLRLVNRCRTAMRRCMEAAIVTGKNNCLLLENGSYHAYRNIAKKLNISITNINAPNALIDLDDLRAKCNKNSFLMIHSSALYSVIQPMDLIEEICNENQCLLINDCTGSITEKELMIGDFLICSFAFELPVNFGTGGFIATNHNEYFKFLPKNNFEIDDPEGLKTALLNCKNRVKYLNEKMLAVLDELSNQGFSCINNNRKINLYLHVYFRNDLELEKISKILVKHQCFYHVNYNQLWVIVMSIDVNEIEGVISRSDGNMIINNFKIEHKPN